MDHIASKVIQCKSKKVSQEKNIDAFGNKDKGKNAILKWSDVEIGKFNQVKSAVMSDALGYFNKEWDTSLEVDARPTGAGSVLFQTDPKDNDMKKIICFYHRVFQVLSKDTPKWK